MYNDILSLIFSNQSYAQYFKKYYSAYPIYKKMYSDWKKSDKSQTQKFKESMIAHEIT